MPASPAPRRFGDFTFDPATGELRGPATVTRLQPQVAALLEFLLEHAEAVVSRAELQARLWPDTTVEFDDGLNFCIRQLRIALGDDANAPRYIETLPRRGYRFLLPVTIDGAQPAVAQRSRRPLAAGLTLLAVVVVIAVLASRGLLPGQRSSGNHIVLAILPFRADTTDSLAMGYRRRLFDQAFVRIRHMNIRSVELLQHVFDVVG